jgi:hypothetical protein
MQMTKVVSRTLVFTEVEVIEALNDFLTKKGKPTIPGTGLKPAITQMADGSMKLNITREEAF